MNTKYGKLVKGVLRYAPDALATGSGVKINPTGASYLAEGWKRIVKNPPATDSAHTAVLSSWTETDDALTAVYSIVESAAEETDGGSSDAPADDGVAKAKVYSKLSILQALKESDTWGFMKMWMDEKSYYDYYLAAQNFAADNPLFIEAVEAFRKYTGKTDEEVQAALDKCIYTA